MNHPPGFAGNRLADRQSLQESVGFSFIECLISMIPFETSADMVVVS
ncbi:MAG: hypothetical protein MK110_11250 [Fuerstiella sp.]|nr:hypothetical protein [Fuerstiella sp.]